jgi:heme exporter protein C
MPTENRIRTDPSSWLAVIAVATTVLGLATLIGAFLYAPADITQGDVQRIFYIHAPIAIAYYLAGAVVALAGVLYLLTRSMTWDIVARCSAEIAVLFTTLMLVTGSLWGKPIWGTWWSWDARLTTALILWFIYVGYLMLRSYVAEPERAARYSVIVGVLGALDIPLVHVSVEWWRTLHPQGIIDSATGSPALPASMLIVFVLGTMTMLMMYLLLMAVRVSVELTRSRIEDLETSELAEPERTLAPISARTAESYPIATPGAGL